MNIPTENSEGLSSTVAAQREDVLQRLAGVQGRLGREGLGPCFLRAAKADPVGDMGFLGSMFLHALVGGPIDELMAEFHLPELTGELGNMLSMGGMEAASLLNETHGNREELRRPRSAFYPLGRRKEVIIKDAKAIKKFNAVSTAGKNGRFSYQVQAELAGMFELMDLVKKLDDQGAQETALGHSRWVHLSVRKPALPPYKGTERRRRPRPDGLFSA